jgi:sulfite exporter TauE/SafE
MLMYHAGRLSVYGALGAIFGILGRHIYLAGFQQLFSIVLGALILLSAILSGMSSYRGTPTWIGRVQQPVTRLIFKLWKSNGRLRYLALGMANGLLPCGMVYLALAAAQSLAQVWESVIFMLVFGAGTLPALLLLSGSRRWAGVRTRAFVRRAMPGMIALVGALLILRGLDLGIPFVSPVMAHGQRVSVSCH